jgi:glycosyltransferase involved in cell wall biosynthesis
MNKLMNNFLPWKVLFVELSQKISALPKYSDYGGLYIVFWWCGIPLGDQEIDMNLLPMTANDLLNLAIKTITPAVGDYLCPKLTTPLQDLVTLEQPLQELCDRLYPKSPNSDSSVSVVICTRDRPEHLAKCLQSLQNLTKRPKEILVVDNAPTTEATCQLVAQMPDIKYILEPRPGLDIARNTGIHHSTGEIVAFTDDDVIVHPDWITRLQESFSDPQVMAMTGLVLAAEIETQSQFIFEKYWGFNRGYNALIFDSKYFDKFKSLGVPVWEIGAGANMAFRNEIFQKIGEFDERLDVGAAGCSGDSEFWYRVLASGGTCRYEPSAVVYHYHRRDLDSLKKQLYYYMRGHVAALLIQFEKYRNWGNIRRLFLSLPQSYMKLFLQGITKGFKLRYSTLFAEISGCISGIIFYLQNRSNTKYSIKKGV